MSATKWPLRSIRTVLLERNAERSHPWVTCRVCGLPFHPDDAAQTLSGLCGLCELAEFDSFALAVTRALKAIERLRSLM